MNTTELTRALIVRLWKSRLLIFGVGILLAILMFFFAYRSISKYTSKASIFPLNSPSANPLAGAGALNGLLGIGDPTQSFSSDASINIIELALSRNVREAVASTKMPNFENRTVAELLIIEKNKHLGIGASKSTIPTDSATLVRYGGSLLRGAIDAKINKNGVLELNFTNTDEALVKPISETIISKISQFYINLRIQKASEDYAFTIRKIDSLNRIVSNFDRRVIGMQNSTMFTPEGKLEYEIPKQNLAEDRERIKAQRNAALANRDEALWRLQKATPIVATLDKPDPPFSVEKKSGTVWAIIGFVVGTILMAIFSITGILYKYIKGEIKRMISGTAT